MRRLALAVVLVVAAAGGAWLLLGRPTGAGPASPTSSPGPVPPAAEVVVDGRALPVRRAELSAAAPATIVAVLVEEGAAVAAGAPLVRLDDAAARAELQAASAGLAAAEADAARASALLGQATAAVDAAAAAVDGAAAGLGGARAARDGLPSGAPAAQRRAADAQVDGARAALEAARADLRGARAARDAAGRAQAAAAADAERARAAALAAQAAVDQLTVSAPFGGTVASLDARAGERAAPGVPLVRLADTSGWLVETTDLDETTVARVPVGARVTITFDGLPGVSVEGVVTSVDLWGASSQGDIVYRAVVTPATIPAGLRWNMTAAVTVNVAP